MMAITSVTVQRPYTSRQRKSNQSLEKSSPEQKKFNFHFQWIGVKSDTEIKGDRKESNCYIKHWGPYILTWHH